MYPCTRVPVSSDHPLRPFNIFNTFCISYPPNPTLNLPRSHPLRSSLHSGPTCQIKAPVWGRSFSYVTRSVAACVPEHPPGDPTAPPLRAARPFVFPTHCACPRGFPRHSRGERGDVVHLFSPPQYPFTRSACVGRRVSVVCCLTSPSLSLVLTLSSHSSTLLSCSPPPVS